MKQLIILLLLSTNLFSQQTTPPGLQVAQINIYKVDSFTYDITYFDPAVYTGVEDVHYGVFKRVVVNNQDYIYLWIEDIIDSLHSEAAMNYIPNLPDSLQLKILDYYFYIKNKKRDGSNYQNH